jgi:hypothetical protein
VGAVIPIAELFAPPPGYNAPPEATRAGAWARPYGVDLARYWAECPCGDWMLWVAGWCRPVPPWCINRGLPWAVRAGAACARLSLQFLPDTDGEARTLLDRVEAWSHSGEPRPRPDWPTTLEASYVELDAAAHAAQCAITQLAAVGLHGTGLGPALPEVLRQLAWWPLRAFGDGMWRHDQTDAIRAQCADVLRASIPAEVVAGMILPDTRPASWQAALAAHRA